GFRPKLSSDTTQGRAVTARAYQDAPPLRSFTPQQIGGSAVRTEVWRPEAGCAHWYTRFGRCHVTATAADCECQPLSRCAPRIACPPACPALRSFCPTAPRAALPALPLCSPFPPLRRPRTPKTPPHARAFPCPSLPFCRSGFSAPPVMLPLLLRAAVSWPPG